MRFIRSAGAAYALLLVGCGGGGSSSSATTVTTPSITSQPASLTVTEGGSATFAVTASGGSLSYQWTKDGSTLSGQTSRTLTLSSVATTDAGDYAVVVSNTAGSVTSSSATLTVQAAAGADVTVN